MILPPETASGGEYSQPAPESKSLDSRNRGRPLDEPLSMTPLRRLLAAVLIGTMSALLSGCSFWGLVNAAQSKSDSEIAAAIAYGGHPRQRMDIYRPARPAENAAVIIFFYGGAWQRGNRENYEFVGRRLASMGHYAVVPDYRVYPEVRFPDFVFDGAKATAHVLDNLSEIAGSRRPVFLMGHSAGAHIAMLLAVDSRYLDSVGQRTAALAGVIGLAGPYDFLPLTSEKLQQVFPTAQAQYRSQPINFIDPDDPPALLAHGDDDRVVWTRNSIRLANDLRNAGIDVELRIYPGVSHIGVMTPFVGFLDDDIGLLDDVQRFVSTGRLPNSEARARFTSL